MTRFGAKMKEVSDKMSEDYRVAIVGVVGAVGNTLIQIFEERAFPVAALKLLDTAQAVDDILEFKDEPIMVEALTHESFENVDLVFSIADTAVSREFIPTAVENGCLVIDISNTFRRQAEIPLIIPEVNIQKRVEQSSVVANPSSSTIQMLVALKPIYDAVGIKRIVVSTYQSVSDKSGDAVVGLVDETIAALEGKPIEPGEFPHQMAFNVAFDWPLLDSGDNEEEIRLVNETQEILEDDSIGVSATTVRVPVFFAHSESINIETERKLTPDEARGLLSQAPGVVVIDDPQNWKYPLAVDVAGKDEVYVGRIREDRSIENGLNLWVVADNLRKGTALNAIQIAEYLI
jgi:aspartate-semialdehyde dehydrogenase